MSHVIVIEDLLTEVSPETPCGDDLEYDPDFVTMAQASQGKDAQQVGDTVVPAEQADWKTVKSKAQDLFPRTKDLRVAVYLTQALVSTDGLAGLHDGLNLVLELLERFWDNVHPQLDPEDNDDPTMRVNTLLNLCGQEAILRSIREVELASAKGMGRVTLRDHLIAEGKIPVPESMESPPRILQRSGATFMSCDLEELQERAEAARLSIGLVDSIESTLMNNVGPKHAVSFDPVADLLKELNEILVAQLVRRGVGVPEAEVGAGGQPISGMVNSREDVIRVLDQACDYFRRSEPSSPVPLLLKRAKKLMSKEFLDIIRDLAPGGVQEVETIRGPDSE